MPEKTYTVIFNDNYSHDGLFLQGKQYDINEEQYQCAKSLGCGYNPAMPLITEVNKTVETKKETVKL